MIEQINFPFNAPLPIVRPFIKQELYQILRFRKSIDEVYETIPAEMFPCDYPGGKGPSLKELRGIQQQIYPSISNSKFFSIF